MIYRDGEGGGSSTSMVATYVGIMKIFEADSHYNGVVIRVLS